MFSRILWIAAIAVLSADAQAPATPAFETASIRPSDPDAPSASMISNPGRWSCANCSLSAILTHAFTAMEWQLVVPEWAYTARFTVVAKLPDGAKREDLKLMLQTLLRERLHMQAHTENREMPVYELVIANGGPKIQPVTDAAPAPPPGPEVDADGYPNVPNGQGIRFLNGRGRIQFRRASMLVLANYLARPAGRPVLAATGLAGDYAFTLSFALPRQATEESNADFGPTIFQAIEQQLGLKLKPAKRSVQVTVIDHVDRAPTEN